MTIQSKILLLLLLIVATFVGGLVALNVSEKAKFKAIADARATERSRIFDQFLEQRGDQLKALVEDAPISDGMVLAIKKGDKTWADQNLTDETLTTYGANAIWIYRPDQSLFFSRNNRYTDELKNLPLPREALDALFTKERTCHFFIQVPQGWMEIRGGTIHPSRDRFRETAPQGSFFVGQFWIDENIRRMALFTEYSIKIVPTQNALAQPSAEESGRIRFSRTLAGWNGKPAAEILVEHDSPIIRELNRASERLFHYLIAFAMGLFLVLAFCLMHWVRRPLHLISHNLAAESPEGLEALSRESNEFGKLAQLILNFRRTEDALHETEEQLRHAQKLEAVGRLAGGIAHDFNNLLTAIIGYSELLVNRFKDDGSALEWASLIRKAGEQAASLTRQLLAFSRKQLLQPKVLDLNALVAEMEKLLRRVIGEHIHISIEAGADEPRILADPTQLEQIILNLGVNARDAMPGGGTLSITTSNVMLDADEIATRGMELHPGKFVVLAVTDTGLGMTQETKDRIFEPFFTTKGPGKGTGLGLATVYGITRQSGGSITVDTEIGKGTTFSIYLPCEAAEIEVSQPIAPKLEPTENFETILVVEDEEVVRELICAVLKDAGYNILSADCPSAAIRTVQEHDAAGIHLVVTDVLMPEMHGPALVQMLAPLQPQMKALYVSGYSENDISDQGVIDRHLEVLQKPFPPQVLVRRVREYLDRPVEIRPQ
ncbi:MAG: ATP-binding protein [Chthoniobacterales bacterium]